MPIQRRILIVCITHVHILGLGTCIYEGEFHAGNRAVPPETAAFGGFGDNPPLAADRYGPRYLCFFHPIYRTASQITNVVDLQPKAAPVLERFAGSTSARLKVKRAGSTRYTSTPSSVPPLCCICRDFKDQACTRCFSENRRLLCSTAHRHTRSRRGFFPQTRRAAFSFCFESPSSAARSVPFGFVCIGEQVLAASSIEGDKRLTLSFRSSQYSPKTLLGRDVSSTLPPLKVNFPEIPGTNAGWVDTTFIDEEIRVARYCGNL